MLARMDGAEVPHATEYRGRSRTHRCFGSGYSLTAACKGLEQSSHALLEFGDGVPTIYVVCQFGDDAFFQ